MVMAGDTIHNFVDGVAIGASFVVSPVLGAITAFSTFLHEVPHEIGDFGILLKAGWRRRNILLTNIISALATLIGAFLVYLMPVGDHILGVFIAIAAGLFLYLGACGGALLQGGSATVQPGVLLDCFGGEIDERLFRDFLF